MNLGQLDIRTVYHNRPQLQTTPSPHSTTPVHIDIDDDRSASITSTISDVTTAIKWITPPPCPTPQRSFEDLDPDKNKAIGVNEAAYASTTPLVVRFDEEQIRSVEAEALERPRMREVDMDSGPPTPNIDDTPYIRFAIDQLTREDDIRATQRPGTGSSVDSYPIQRIIPDFGLGYLKAERKELAAARRDRSSLGEQGILFKFNPTRPLSRYSNPTPTDIDLALKTRTLADRGIFIPVTPPVNTPQYPELSFVPMILRPLSMIMLSLLCLLMTAAVMFCAIYSTYHNGLVQYTGGIYGGRYFIFRFLPEILASFIFIYVQGVMSAISRIMPFVLMAMDGADRRADAVFVDMFPRSLMWPKWDGPPVIAICNFVFWLTVFTIPLQSCLFSVREVAGVYQWTAVQGIAWTLAALYILLLISTLLACLFFYKRTTGLMWDPRSLADIISLLHRSNSMRDYPGTDIMKSKQEIRTKLALRSDRLGYWRTHNQMQTIFYCIGEEGTSTRRYTLEDGKLHEKPSGAEVYHPVDLESTADVYSSYTRFRFIPWYLRDTFVILWSTAALIILAALLVVSFLPSTALRKGFPPLVSAAPNAAGFSLANFLYNFVSSFLGLLLYLLFQPLDMAFRKLKPWVELGKPDGATARQSLLLDYPAALPIICTLKALNAGHYRVAVLSLLSFLFILLPILGGGLFFALATPDGDILMIPNLTSFYIIIALLVLYVVALLLLIPKRHLMYLPHAIDSLAEIFSFAYGSALLDDEVFRAPRSKPDLVTRLVTAQTPGTETRYAFMVYKGRHGKPCLGIEKLGMHGARLP